MKNVNISLDSDLNWRLQIANKRLTFLNTARKQCRLCNEIVLKLVSASSVLLGFINLYTDISKLHYIWSEFIKSSNQHGCVLYVYDL
jgi:hypothetical protein